MVRSQADEDDSAIPGSQFWYAQVLGVFHAFVHVPGKTDKQRMNFLWVRWMGIEPDQRSGRQHRKLTKLGYVPDDEGSIPFGFVDPAHVLRACHLIPAFEDGRTNDLLEPSFVKDKGGDWTSYYINERVLFFSTFCLINNTVTGILDL